MDYALRASFLGLIALAVAATSASASIPGPGLPPNGYQPALTTTIHRTMKYRQKITWECFLPDDSGMFRSRVFSWYRGTIDSSAQPRTMSLMDIGCQNRHEILHVRVPSGVVIKDEKGNNPSTSQGFLVILPANPKPQQGNPNLEHSYTIEIQKNTTCVIDVYFSGFPPVDSWPPPAPKAGVKKFDELEDGGPPGGTPGDEH